MNAVTRLLGDAQLEPDQYLAKAIDMCATHLLRDTHIFMALVRLNAISIRRLGIDETKLLAWPRLNEVHFDYLNLDRVPVEEVESLHPDLIRMLRRAASSTNKTLTTSQFLSAWIHDALDTGDNFTERSFGVDMLVSQFAFPQTTPLSRVLPLQDALTRLGSTRNGDDFQYFIGLEQGRIVFRVASVLDDYIQVNDSGIWCPRRALLTHFKDQFGGFTSEEIEELQELLNGRSSGEADFQLFFERHPHFLRQWDHREVYPHVTLARPEGPLIPDFILTDRELQRAAIVDLKLATPKLIRRQRNRERFASAVMEARAQLLRYRDWFREKENRRNLVGQLGMEVYEPQLIVVMGRASEFQDDFDRQRLRADHPEITVVTYDDIVKFAERRRIVIESQQTR